MLLENADPKRCPSARNGKQDCIDYVLCYVRICCQQSSPRCWQKGGSEDDVDWSQEDGWQYCLAMDDKHRRFLQRRFERIKQSVH
jgi:hypothetical protein